MTALPHRCTISRPTGARTDAYGQPVATGYAADDGVPCRFSARRPEAPRLIVGRGTALDLRDRVSDVRRPDGTVIDAGPFAVERVSAPAGRVRAAYRRARLLRLAGREG
jgi:hypothetical protein